MPRRDRKQPVPGFGAFLANRLAVSGMTRREFAERAGLSIGYVGKLINDKAVPPAEDTLREIAGLVSTPPDVLMFAARIIPADLEAAILDCNPEAVRRFARQHALPTVRNRGTS